MICPNCETKNDEDARFCKQCGDRTTPFESKLQPSGGSGKKPRGNPNWFEFSPEDFEALRADLDLSPSSPYFGNPLWGKNITISLILDALSLEEFWHCVARAGALMKKNVSGALDILVEGDDPSGKYEKGKTGKSVKARELNAAGKASIDLIDEKTLLSYLGLRLVDEVRALGIGAVK